MKAQCTIAVTALCGMLLGMPAARAQDKELPPKNHYIEFSLPGEDHFTPYPKELTLRVGEYYRLVLMNGSQELRHILMAPEFARDVVTVRVRKFPGGEEIRLASFESGIHVPPGERVEVVILPVVEGRYKFFCQDRTHTNAGMEMTVEVVGSRL